MDPVADADAHARRSMRDPTRNFHRPSGGRKAPDRGDRLGGKPSKGKCGGRESGSGAPSAPTRTPTGRQRAPQGLFASCEPRSLFESRQHEPLSVIHTERRAITPGRGLRPRWQGRRIRSAQYDESGRFLLGSRRTGHADHVDNRIVQLIRLSISIATRCNIRRIDQGRILAPPRARIARVPNTGSTFPRRLPVSGERGPDHVCHARGSTA